MNLLLAIYLTAVAGLLGIMMIRQHRKGQVELLSIRNLGILGFILFQLTSGAVALATGDFGIYRVNDPTGAGVTFAAMSTVFILIALWVYKRGFIADRVARLVPAVPAAPGIGGMMLMAVLVTLVAAALRFGVKVPLIGIVAGQVGMGMAAVATAVAGWVWGRQLFNPVYVLFGVTIVLINLGIVMYGVFGRRGLVAVGGALLWGMYYSHWRYLSTTGILSRMALLSVPPILVVALFSSVREAGEHDRTLTEHIQEMTSRGSFAEGLGLLAGGQGVGAVSMFLIDTHPQPYEYNHLESLWHFVFYPVPRAWWSGKPLPLSRHIPYLAQLTRVDRSTLSIAPGIIGTGAAEGGWYALVLYAVIYGMFLRLFDRVIELNPRSPFIILSIGCAMGQIIGLARGQTSSFAFLALLAVVGSLAGMIVFGKIVEKLGGGAPDGEEQWDEAYAYDEAEDEYGYRWAE